MTVTLEAPLDLGAAVESRRPAPPPISPERIVDATLSCLARWGVAKTTLDDVAREAGVGRATLYRLFPGGRDALFAAVVATEAGRFTRALDAALADAHSLEDVIVTGVWRAAALLREHKVLRFLLAHEPESILPHLAFERQTALLAAVAAMAAPWLGPWLPTPDAETAARAAEWLARIVMSYLVCPSAQFDLADRESVRRLVRSYVMPGLVPVDIPTVPFTS